MSRAWLIAALVVVAGCSSDEADPVTSSVATAPASTTSVPAPTTTSGATTPDSTTSVLAPTTTSVAGTGVTPEGFEAVAGEITAADGEVCAVCLWAAATPEQRGRGLMAVTDMGGADGMVFLFGEPTTSAFWMRDTPMPLSIAFFDAAGAFVSAADMAPCLDGAPEDCPHYQAGGPYTSAIEVPQGGLDELLIGPGSRLDLLDTPCAPAP